MNLTTKLLISISAQEPTSFSELCAALGDDTPKTSEGWREVCQTLEVLEVSELLKIERGRVSSASPFGLNNFTLTQLGAERAREALEIALTQKEFSK